MNEPASFAAPLELTEKARTPSGPMRIVLSTYSSGALLVELLPDIKPALETSKVEISSDVPGAEQLKRGEFAAQENDADLLAALLKGNLFRSTGRKLAGKDIWSLDGLAIIELHSAYAPPIAATRASFPSHLFHDKAFDPEAQKTLIAAFEENGYMRHSAAGASIWMLREYCERMRIPFAIYLLKQGEEIAGILFCKKEFSSRLCKGEIDEGHTVQTVYESPIYRAG